MASPKKTIIEITKEGITFLALIDVNKIPLEKLNNFIVENEHEIMVSNGSASIVISKIHLTNEIISQLKNRENAVTIN